MRRLFGALALVLALAAPAHAFAVESAKVPTAKLTGVDVQLWPEDVSGGMTIIVVGTLTSDTPLPAKVSLPFPAGAQPTWAGELFGTTNEDVARQPSVDATAHTLDFIAQKSRQVQYEAQYKPYTDKDGRRFAELDWIQSVAAGSEKFAFKLPPTSSDVNSNPPYMGQPDVNTSGEKLYSLADRSLKQGETFKLTVDYVPRAPKSPTSPAEIPDWILPLLFVFLGIAVVAVIVVAVRGRSADE